MAHRVRLTSRVASPDAHAPVTTLELFFDLVFVFTVTQLTDLVLEPHPVRHGTRACLDQMPRQRSWHPRPVRQGGGARAQRAAPSADNAAGRDAGPRTPWQM